MTIYLQSRLQNKGTYNPSEISKDFETICHIFCVCVWAILCCFIWDETSHVHVISSCEGVINLLFWAFGHCKDETVILRMYQEYLLPLQSFQSEFSANHFISRSLKCIGEISLILLKSRE